MTTDTLTEQSAVTIANAIELVIGIVNHAQLNGIGDASSDALKEHVVAQAVGHGLSRLTTSNT